MKQGLPENGYCIGNADKQNKIFVEQYVVNFLTEMTEQETKAQIVVFYGDGYEEDGCRYYFLKGAASHAASGEAFGKMDEFYFQNIGKKYFPKWKGIGWYHTGETNERCEVLAVLRKMREQDFSKLGGCYIYYEKNPEMEEYLISHKKTCEKEGNDKHSAGNAGVGRKMKKVHPAPVQAIQILNMVSLCILIICCIIAVTTINQYDKMKRLEKTVNYLEASMEEHEISEKQKNLPEE